MADDFIYGRCLPWRATVSTEFCRAYKTSGKDKCQTCEGLIMDIEKQKAPAAKAAPAKAAQPEPIAAAQPEEPVAEKSFVQALKNLMTIRGLSAKALAQAIGLSDVTVGYWLRGKWMPTIVQAGLLDEYFQINLSAAFKEQLRPEAPGRTGRPKAKAVENQAPRLAAADTAGLKHPGPPEQPAISPEPPAGQARQPAAQPLLADERHWAFLSEALECLVLILKAWPLGRRP